MSRREESTRTSAFLGPHSPLILDSDMGGTLPDAELEFFDSAFAHDSPASPSHLLDDDFLAAASAGTSLNPVASCYDSPAKFPHARLQVGSSPLTTTAAQPLSAASPESSVHDSSSDDSRRHKRKSSSNSSRSALIGQDITMMEDADMSDWKPDELMMGGDGASLIFDGHGFSLHGDANPLSLDTDLEMSNKAMENHFDFDSATSSPSPVAQPANPTESTSKRKTQKADLNKPRNPSKASVNSRSRGSVSSQTTRHNGFFLGNSREVSPLSAMVTSQESSPTNIFNAATPSSTTGDDFGAGPMLGATPHNAAWPTTFSFTQQNALHNSFPPAGLTPTMFAHGLASPLSSKAASECSRVPTLTIHPTPLKSRVETQIPIRMTLHPMPPGVTKLHLPTHTISKPKLLAKPSPPKSPDMLELHTMLVCTSAMQNPANLQRALRRAAGLETPVKKEERRSSSGDAPQAQNEDGDTENPLNGGEVSICLGCITRERKRAARKKVKKVEEEESWHQYENKRVIVFNTQEVKEWHEPAKDDNAEQFPPYPEGALQVDAPMRIACYCRHQNEKVGFQVIFTIKDHEDRVVAQAVTSSIMITDDHKTHAAPPPLPAPTSTLPDGTQLPGVGVFPSAQNFEVPVGPFRVSHSTPDLQAMQHSFGQQFATAPHPFAMAPAAGSQTTSASLTPRHLSRQASPPAPSGHSAKKRKSSSSAKVPSGLVMTTLDSGPPPTSAPSATTPTAPTSAGLTPQSATAANFPPNMNPFVPPPADRAFIAPPLSVPPTFNTGPPTPNSNDQGFHPLAHRSQSMESLPIPRLFSTPTSTDPSRPPSPGSASRSTAFQQSQAQMAQAVANSFYGIPLALNPHRPPTIHKLIPNEGPKAGGIEVTCLGNGFCQGLEVMFGDSLATTTTYWGDTSLVCLLPPAAQAGTVPVTFKHQHQQHMQMPGYPTPPVAQQQVFFKYVDDDEQQLLRMALSVLGHKMTGRMEDVRDIARRIVGGGNSSWAPPAAGSSTTGGTQHSQAAGLSAALLGAMDTESTLLKCLDLIDLDDSPHLPRLNLRRSSGQTMLHTACALGYHRFVAALLARGANPDPRDRGGYTPMMLAAMHNHPQIVRRLIMNGADPTLRNLRGFTAADLAVSEEVLQSTRRIERHVRTRSAGPSFSRRRRSSAASLRSLWEPPLEMTYARSMAAPVHEFEASSSDESVDEDYEDDSDDSAWTEQEPADKRVPPPASQLSTRPATTGGNGFVGGAMASPTAAMAAWRDHLAAQLHHFQQSFNIPMPTLPPLPDYQNNNIARRISSLVPHRGSSARPSVSSSSTVQASNGNNGQSRKQGGGGDSYWSQLFSSSSTSTASSPPPPSYEEIYPERKEYTEDMKKTSVLQAAVDATMDQHCEQTFDKAQTESSSATTTVAHSRAPSDGESDGTAEAIDVKIGRKTTITREQQAQLRRAHKKSLKRIRSDRKLFFVWIPLLLIIICAMLKNQLPALWASLCEFVEPFVPNVNLHQRFVGWVGAA
ncbi:hypothetical protein L228DRAFT_240505 [Xylona heveae TC161]|uniref:IPT/TIG domain-containing protein n=1 Tax=Xylona heveae (strain CBS 132557 / TC161) TaxID=1328760 RepID=A0A165F9T1_XYLHT|nr:hypothetical protein L228DRAFT_240505 [Xylona heveae TC161]KZF20745.1 hypothetical protein L228DRAFT_240505 [Xylona heveae TC161]